MSSSASSTTSIAERINRLADNLDPIPGQPSADDIFILRCKLINELYPEHFDVENGIHNLMGIVATPAKYKAKFGAEFPTYKPQPAIGKDMDSTDSSVRHVATVRHRAKVADYEKYKEATNAVRSLLLNHVDETWIIALRKEETEYGEVTPAEILAHELCYAPTPSHFLLLLCFLKNESCVLLRIARGLTRKKHLKVINTPSYIIIILSNCLNK